MSQDQHYQVGGFDVTINGYRCVCGGYWNLYRGAEPVHRDPLPAPAAALVERAKDEHNDEVSRGSVSDAGDALACPAKESAQARTSAEIAAVAVRAQAQEPLEGKAYTLESLCWHLGVGTLTPEAAYAFLFERSRLLSVVQAALETFRSDAPTAEGALLERIAALRSLRSDREREAEQP